ncbi:uncharacterized protein LOC133851559 isoform X2 [Alnus glutinosa]|uniref:uncharacterized protein LOC133851559 isoform X2 n=1 Tax=Alnus glutinosa TaxID=3517 RepID=UPI002D791D95|nr:uncharacterized protein LOC133851559 isoform X2 [Alnus glutinosa]
MGGTLTEGAPQVLLQARLLPRPLRGSLHNILYATLGCNSLQWFCILSCHTHAKQCNPCMSDQAYQSDARADMKEHGLLVQSTAFVILLSLAIKYFGSQFFMLGVGTASLMVIPFTRHVLFILFAIIYQAIEHNMCSDCVRVWLLVFSFHWELFIKIEGGIWKETYLFYLFVYPLRQHSGWYEIPEAYNLVFLFFFRLWVVLV